MSAISHLNPKAEVVRAAQALQINISAARGLADVLKTNLGVSAAACTSRDRAGGGDGGDVRLCAGVFAGCGAPLLTGARGATPPPFLYSVHPHSPRAHRRCLFLEAAPSRSPRSGTQSSKSMLPSPPNPNLHVLFSFSLALARPQDGLVLLNEMVSCGACGVWLCDGLENLLPVH